MSGANCAQKNVGICLTCLLGAFLEYRPPVSSGGRCLFGVIGARPAIAKQDAQARVILIQGPSRTVRTARSILQSHWCELCSKEYAIDLTCLLGVLKVGAARWLTPVGGRFFITDVFVGAVLGLRLGKKTSNGSTSNVQCRAEWGGGQPPLRKATACQGTSEVC